MRKPELADFNSDLDNSPTDEGEDKPDYNDGLQAAAKAMLTAIHANDPAALADALQSAVGLCSPADEPESEGSADDEMPGHGKGMLIIASPKKG